VENRGTRKAWPSELPEGKREKGRVERRKGGKEGGREGRREVVRWRGKRKQ
jgi:hypothetical protein